MENKIESDICLWMCFYEIEFSVLNCVLRHHCINWTNINWNAHLKIVLKIIDVSSLVILNCVIWTIDWNVKQDCYPGILFTNFWSAYQTIIIYSRYKNFLIFVSSTCLLLKIVTIRSINVCAFLKKNIFLLLNIFSRNFHMMLESYGFHMHSITAVRLFKFHFKIIVTRTSQGFRN